MSIRLNRKKLLCISFFLCCVLPACFSWFSVDDTQWRGLSLMEMPLLISTSLFAFALLFERIRYVLPIGILSHILLTIHLTLNFVNFPMTAGFSAERSILPVWKWLAPCSGSAPHFSCSILHCSLPRRLQCKILPSRVSLHRNIRNNVTKQDPMCHPH